MEYKSIPHAGNTVAPNHLIHHPLVYRESESRHVENARIHSGILGILLKLVVAFCVILCTGEFITYLVFRPNMPEINITKASLTKFSVDGSGNVIFNLTLDVSVNNTNRKLEVYCKHLEAVATYHGQPFSQISLPSFHQKPMNVTTFRPTFSGRSRMQGSDRAKDFFTLQEGGGGWFPIDVKFSTKMWLKTWPLSSVGYAPVLNCPLLVRSVSSKGSGDLNSKRCDVEFPDSGTFFFSLRLDSCYYCIVSCVLILLYLSVFVYLHMI